MFDTQQKRQEKNHWMLKQFIICIWENKTNSQLSISGVIKTNYEKGKPEKENVMSLGQDKTS